MRLPGKNTLSGLVLLGIASIVPASAFAHTGIGQATGFGAGFLHPFMGLDHLLVMFAVGLWAAQLGGKASWVVPGSFVALMIGGGMLAVAKVHLPFVEQGILVSVVVLGLLIASAFRLPILVSAMLVGVFAVFHGFAHGAEMPLAAGAVSYSVGFALATTLLHISGIGSGALMQKLSIEKLVRFAGGVIALGGIYMAVA